MLKLSTTILIFFLYFSLYAQHNNWESETITVDDGLHSDAVTAILKDRQGFMWFATKNGLQRYDGYQLKSYQYPFGDSLMYSFIMVLDLCEDQDGNLWIATNNGLKKLDLSTDQIIHYTHDPQDTLSISAGEVLRVFADSKGMIWAGTKTGLNRFDEKKGTFTRYVHNPDDTTSLNRDYITCVYEDRQGTLWIGIGMGGLHKMDRTSGTFQHFFVDPQDTTNWSNSVLCIYEDNATNLWVGTADGLFLFDRKAHSFSRLIQEKDSQAPKSQMFAAVCENYDGNYFVRTFAGLYLYDPDMNKLNAWEHPHRSPIRAVWRDIRSLYLDSSGILWYSKHYRGIEKLIPNNNKFRFYQNNPEIESRSIGNIYVENQDIIWMHSNGLSRFDRRKNEFQLFQHDPKDSYSLSNNRIQCIFQDRKGRHWIGTDTGLNKLVYNHNGPNRFIRYFHNPNVSSSINNSDVFRISEDHTGRLFFNYYDGTIDFFNEEKEEFDHIEYAVGDLKINQFGGILLVEPDKIWAADPRGNLKGIFELILPLKRSGTHTIAPDTVIHHKPNPGTPGSFNINKIICMHKDHSGNYWLGTGGLGFYSMVLVRNHATGAIDYQIKRYTKEQDGLTNNEVNSILADNKGKLWLGTEYGISRFDPLNESFTNYDKTDGLISYAFSFKSNKLPDGEMFFPSDKGLLAFYPDSIQDNPIIPPVAITDFRIFDEPVVLDGKPLEHKSQHRAEQITLPYNKNFLSIEYAALNYLYPEKNLYKYKMEGLDPDWIEAGTRRHADYPDLKPGDYTFRVIGSNNDGIWNTEGASLQITINPPWWASYYAYASYFILSIFFITGYVRLRTWQIKKQTTILEGRVKRRTAQIEAHKEEIESQKEILEEQNRKILEMGQIKSKFFSNVSHEFRTPLTLIQGPVDDLLSHARLKKNELGKLDMISRNAKRLLTLVNQLLDIAKLESGMLKLKLVNENIFHSIRIITNSFSSLAETKGIIYNRTIPVGKYNTWFDSNILEKVIVNLLSNAFKYTPEGGQILFSARWFHGKTEESPDMLEISVSDDGQGISEDEKEKIFTRFYQAKNDGPLKSIGSGIGLSLVHDLVELYHGEIKVESKLEKGSHFIVCFPLGKAHLKEEEYILLKDKNEEDNSVKENIMLIESHEEKKTTSIHERNGKKSIILIVEDNNDIRCHISDNLNHDFQLIEAVNGSAGLKKALEVIPDLIITDLIMPVMDGLELCRKIKSDECTSHIPIIMLTAKSSLEERLEGLETGADDYLSKPFNMKELNARIANLIEQRKMLRERYSNEITIEPSEIAITSIDEAFLNRAIQVVEKHMTDENFDLSQFQGAMNMSHSTLFRKIYALTNQSPTEFIRNLRLKRGAQLLKDRFGNVAEVSFEVGFNNPSYFSKCFKTLFGISPAEYSKNESKILSLK